MNVKDEERLLHEICRNTDMGREAIDQMLKDVYDEEFARELYAEAVKMQDFEKRANARLVKDGKEEAQANPVTKKMLKTAVKMKTAISDQTSRMADIMQKGNKRGAEQLCKAIHKYKDAGTYATELAREMIDFEEDNLKKLDAYIPKKS